MSKTTDTHCLSLDRWIKSTISLLSLEQKEEIDTIREELSTLNDHENPNVLGHLTLSGYFTGLFGRSVLQLSFPSFYLQYPKPHHFTVGDLIQLRGQKKSNHKLPPRDHTLPTGKYKLPTGIISRLDEQNISIVLDDTFDEINEMECFLDTTLTITMDRLMNATTFQKVTNVLDQMAKGDYQVAESVVNIVFFEQKPSWNTPLQEFIPFTMGLNDSQIQAIQFALASKDLAVIHGPPGTGKTTTIVELMLQAVCRYDMKILVCAPSNIAVDNVLEKLATTCSRVGKRLLLTRIGHPARVLPQIVKYCLDAKIQQAEGTEIVDDIRKEMSGLQTKLQKTRDQKVRFQLRRELKANRKEIRVREQKVVGEIIRHSNVVFATNIGAASKLLKDMTFDLVVIDEAAQALEASCWIPILKAKRCVLAGDHLQLPPTIKSKTAAAKGLDVTLFDRIINSPNTQSIVKMLTTQYRMHEKISEWSSQAMYNGELKSSEGVAKRMLHELPHVNIRKDDDLLDATLLLLDTAGCELEEDADDDEDKKHSILRLSKSNEGEARVVARHVRALLEAGLKEDEVAVITPYNKQVQTLKALLLEKYPKLEIRSVDGFQGCEKEAVVMSLVRSNASRQVGFLADDRRMNVAITRAKRHVAVVCDTDTISSHKFLAALVKHFEDFGEYRSAQEYLEEDAVEGTVDEQVMSLLSAATSDSAPSRASAVKHLSNAAATATHAKATKSKQTQTVKKEVKADVVLTPKSVEDTQTDGECHVVATEINTVIGSADVVVVDEEKESEDELEDKAAATKSIFQMMSESDSSEDEQESSNGHQEGVSEGEINSDASKESIVEAANCANMLLKDLHLSRLARQPVELSVPSSGKTNKKHKKKKKNAAKAAAHTAPIAEPKDGEDELEYLTRQAKKSSSCAFQSSSRCKKSITMLGSVCKFCKLKFCYSHVLPEVHGCNDAVRKFEQVAFQEMMSRSTDRKPKLTVEKRKLLQKKLKEQVSAKTASRTTQPTTTKK
ncbi:unnamed protein product [Peronospora belbahrii]|uniref:DNA helicase n=1 Tax=Peronospora belbahrii TaxID=622444 RepID=A0AAU9LAZ0_9STRA|nr:unnamed protein product [Peronospora belbahrii]CAH0516110.1 unnamed protein product [Peronospora belbahrii]